MRTPSKVKIIKYGKVVASSHNLRAIIRYAGRPSVWVDSAHVYREHTGGAYLNVKFNDGAECTTRFEGFSVAVWFVNSRRSWSLTQYATDPYGGPMWRIEMTPLEKIEGYAVIIRCIHCRGTDQEAALIELERRRMWLSADQRKQAGLDY